MTIKKKNIDKGIVIKPDSDALEGIDGEIKIDTADDKIKTTLGGDAKEIITDDQTQTLTNKTIDQNSNTITNLDTTNIDPAALDTDLSSVSGSHDTLTTAKAVRDYVDSLGPGSDSKVKASATDTTSNTLDQKITAGTNVTFTILNPGADESIQIDATGDGNDKAGVSANDTTPGFLLDKITAGTGITLTEINDAGDEDLEIKADPSAINIGDLNGIDTTGITTGEGLYYNGTELVPGAPRPLNVDLVVGNAADVTAGIATHSTIASAITAASAGDEIMLLPRTFTENVTIAKEVTLRGKNRNSVIDGTLDLNAGASGCEFMKLRVTNDITVASGVQNCIFMNMSVDNGVIVTDNNTETDDNLYLIDEEV